jgi:formylglycine-generating enzyme required for sulfatase activity
MKLKYNKDISSIISIEMMKRCLIPLFFFFLFFSAFGQHDISYVRQIIKYKEPKIDTFKSRPLGVRSAITNKEDSKYKDLLNRKSQKVFENMVFVESGVFNKSTFYDFQISKFDTQLLSYYVPEKVSVSNFMMSKYEVTNKEYREFVFWVRDSIVRSYLAKGEPEKYYFKNTTTLNWEVPIDWENKSVQDEFIKIYDDEYGYDSFFNTKTIDFSYLQSDGKIKTLNVYPDTLSWINEYQYFFNEPIAQLYFWHPVYDNHPVVGVSWQQANAFCHWKTVQFKKKYPEYEGFEFRLPTENEWEYSVKKPLIFKENDYRWTNTDAVPQNCNHGDIRDENLITVTSSLDDGLKLPGPVNAYFPNGSGIYNLQGNVAEWTFDKPKIFGLEEFLAIEYSMTKGDIDSLEKYGLFEINDTMSINDIVIRIAHLSQLTHDSHWFDLDNENDVIYLKEIAKALLHDRRIIQNTENPRVVKGGSFADPTIYLIPSTRVVQSETAQSCKIGFRVAMSVEDEMLPIILKKKVFKKLKDTN